VTHWRKHISKKAEKRYKKRRERVVEAKQAAAQVTALTVPTTLPALPSPSALAEMSTQNRIIIESLLSHDAPAPSSGAAQLSADETAALLTGFQTGTVERSRETLQAALRALSAQGRFTETLELFSSMRRWGLQPDTIEYNHLILACARQRNVGAAFSVYDSMVRGAVPVDGVTFGGLMQACIRTGNLPRAFQQLQIAEAAGLPLTPVLFTHLIVGCVRAGEFDRAWLVFDHMRTKHCEPDSVAFTAMISACAKRDQVERAVNLLTEMKQLSLPITAVTYNAMIHAAGRSFRQAHLAHTYFNEMTVAGHAHDDYSYTAVLTACSHTGDVLRARTYMWQAMKEGIRPSLFTLNALLAVYMRALRKPKASVERSEEARAMALSDAKAGELLQLEDPESAAKLLAGQKRVLGDYARIVEGDPNQLVENLLADYYQEDNTGDKPMKRDKGRDVEDVDASAPGSLITAAKDGVDDDPFVPADPSSLLPQVSEYNQDLTHPDYLEAKESLIKDIGISPALFDKLEADNEVPFAIDTDEEMLRAEVEAREDRKLRVREAADAMELLQLEADVAAQKAALRAEAREAAGVLGSGLVDVDVLADDGGDHPMLGGRGKKAAAAGGGSGAAKGGAGRSRPEGGVVFDDIMQEAQTTAGRRRGARARAGARGGGDGAAAVAGAGAGGDAAAAEGTVEADGSRTLPDGSRIIGSIHLPPPGPDGRVRFKDYLKALEASLEKDIFGSAVMSGGSSEGSDNDAARRGPRALAAGTDSAAPRLLSAGGGDGGAADAARAGAGGDQLVVAEGSGAAASARARKPRRQVSLFDSDSDVEVGG
jgi:pentatricopeptide repeat protein